MRTLRTIRRKAVARRVVVTAESTTQARHLYACGADYVLQPSETAAVSLAEVIERNFKGELPVVRQIELDRLEEDEAEVLR